VIQLYGARLLERFAVGNAVGFALPIQLANRCACVMSHKREREPLPILVWQVGLVGSNRKPQT
jgi:hypothetical protein